MSASTCEEHPDLVMQEYGDCSLAVLNVDSSSHKRTASNVNDEESIELCSPGKRPRLEEESSKDYQPETVTKIADSPLKVKDEPSVNKDACMDSRAESIEPIKLEDIKTEQECTKKEEGELELAKLSQMSNDQEKCDSQVSTRVNISDQAEPSDNKQEDTNLQIVFSDEEDEGGANGSHVTSGRMLSSQMNRQIDRVQVFLKLERLRRPKK